jgi:hypothetical protein
MNAWWLAGPVAVRNSDAATVRPHLKNKRQVKDEHTNI